ncbi:MAG TPA: hypothetical protein VGL78_11435 [Solirubrobacteraceae bacterium]
MSTITVPRADVTSEEVTDALRNGLDPRYDVASGMRMPRSEVLTRDGWDDFAHLFGGVWLQAVAALN